MALSLKEIQDRLTKPLNKETLIKAIKHENRLRFHTNVSMDRNKSEAVTDYLDWVKDILPRDKYVIFLQLFKFPVETNELVEQIYNSLYKIFDGRDPVRNYEFTDSEYKNEFVAYKGDIEFEKKWKKQSWEKMKTGINSMIVVDLPMEQLTESPEPYYYFLSVNDIHDFCAEEGLVKDVFFYPEEFILSVYDDEYYRVFELNEDKTIKDIIVENKHDLGYCPAQWFWHTNLESNNDDLKSNPISNQLSKIDWFLFYSISKKHLDLYGAYPVYTSFEVDCEYQNIVNGEVIEECEDGYLRRADKQYLINSDGELEKCPLCSNKVLHGPGSHITVPYPEDKEMHNTIDAIKVIGADVPTLEYNTTEVDRLKTLIYTNVTGYATELTNQAINEKQVEASFESRATVLKKLKANFEWSENWTLQTIAKLKQGDRVAQFSTNYGNEFYLFSEDELIQMYSTARDKGMSDIVLDYINDQLLETKYRNNPEELQRSQIMFELMPYPHLSTNTLITNRESIGISDDDLTIRLQFINFIKQFERENGSIVKFGELIDYDKKINIINETLRNYASSTRKESGNESTRDSENRKED